jgi:hypothetical protein
MKLLFLLSFFADERVLTLSRIDSARDLQETAAIVRAMADPAQVTLEGKALKVQGTSPEIAAAAWLTGELDQPSGKTEFTITDGERIRIFTFSAARDVQELQEAATLVRSMVEIRRLFVFNAPRKIVARGTSEQIEQTAWLLDRLPALETAELKLPQEQLLRVYALPQYKGTQEFQEAATVLRSIAEIRHVLTYNPSRKIAMRGDAKQLAMVDFMLQEFDNAGDSKRQHRTEFSDRVRVFDGSRLADLQEHAVTMRSTMDIRRLFTLPSRKKIVVRGTVDDIEFCEWMMADGARRDFALGLVRQFPLAFPTNVQELQEAATVARSIGEIRRMYAENATKTVFVRGSQSEIDLTDWVFRQLATAPTDAASREYQYGADIVKIFFLKRDAVDIRQLQDTALRVRRETGIPRLFTYNAYRAIVVRCTPEQAAQAEALLR